MTTHKEVLELAFKTHSKNESHRTLAETRYWCDQYKLLAKTAIEALAQPEQICGFDVVLDESMPTNTFKLTQPEQKPVAWLYEREHSITNVHLEQMEGAISRGWVEIPLYTIPPQRKPWVSLSDEDIERIAKKARSKDHAITLAQRESKERNT